VKRARGKQLAPDEYNSGTFTISNLGMYGVDTFDAILPPGEFGECVFLGRGLGAGRVDCVTYSMCMQCLHEAYPVCCSCCVGCKWFHVVSSYLTLSLSPPALL
jgi:pyruvate dehydrogenase E2 component (dihydrolipoamide acetyltransferase)